MGRKVWVFAGHTNTVQHCQSLVDRNEAFLAAGIVALHPDGNTKILFNFKLEKASTKLMLLQCPLFQRLFSYKLGLCNTTSTKNVSP